MALAGGPHVLAYRAAGLKEHDAFWRCIQVILIYGVFQLARMFLATLVYFNFDTLSPAGLFNYELLGVLINLLAVRFTYSRMFGRSEIAVFLGCIGWSYGDLIFTKIVPIWTGTRLLEFDWAYIALSLDANFELIFNFVIFLTPWLLMRKGRNVLATCVSVIIFIVACFHLSIFGLIEQQTENLFYVIVVKLLFTLSVGFVGLLLKITWTTEASYESKKQSDDPLSLFKHINKWGTLRLQTLRNALTNASTQRTTLGRRNG